MTKRQPNQDDDFQPPDHLEPRLNPLAEELLDALAYLMVENDSYRVRLNMAPRNGALLLTAQDRARGNSTGPRAFLNAGDLRIRLEK